MCIRDSAKLLNDYIKKYGKPTADDIKMSWDPGSKYKAFNEANNASLSDEKINELREKATADINNNSTRQKVSNFFKHSSNTSP